LAIITQIEKIGPQNIVDVANYIAFAAEVHTADLTKEDEAVLRLGAGEAAHKYTVTGIAQKWDVLVHDSGSDFVKRIIIRRYGSESVSSPASQIGQDLIYAASNPAYRDDYSIDSIVKTIAHRAEQSQLAAQADSNAPTAARLAESLDMRSRINRLQKLGVLTVAQAIDARQKLKKLLQEGITARDFRIRLEDLIAALRKHLLAEIKRVGQAGDEPEVYRIDFNRAQIGISTDGIIFSSAGVSLRQAADLDHLEALLLQIPAAIALKQKALAGARLADDGPFDAKFAIHKPELLRAPDQRGVILRARVNLNDPDTHASISKWMDGTRVGDGFILEQATLYFSTDRRTQEGFIPTIILIYDAGRNVASVSAVGVPFDKRFAIASTLENIVLLENAAQNEYHIPRIHSSRKIRRIIRLPEDETYFELVQPKEEIPAGGRLAGRAGEVSPEMKRFVIRAMAIQDPGANGLGLYVSSGSPLDLITDRTDLFLFRLKSDTRASVPPAGHRIFWIKYPDGREATFMATASEIHEAVSDHQERPFETKLWAVIKAIQSSYQTVDLEFMNVQDFEAIRLSDPRTSPNHDNQIDLADILSGASKDGLVVNLAAFLAYLDKSSRAHHSRGIQFWISPAQANQMDKLAAKDPRSAALWKQIREKSERGEIQIGIAPLDKESIKIKFGVPKGVRNRTKGTATFALRPVRGNQLVDFAAIGLGNLMTYALAPSNNPKDLSKASSDQLTDAMLNLAKHRGVKLTREELLKRILNGGWKKNEAFRSLISGVLASWAQAIRATASAA
jgi:hypothetical protein